MESFGIGDRVFIRRSNGKLQPAQATAKNVDRQLVVVEWMQDGRPKSKTVSLKTLLQLNPSMLSAAKTPKMTTRYLSNVVKSKSGRSFAFEMYERKDASKATPPRLSSDKDKESKASPGATTVKNYSNVVHEIQRLNQQREERRTKIADERQRRDSLKNKHSNNSNWEVAKMIEDYRKEMPCTPLRELSPRDTRIKRISVCVRKRPLSRLELRQHTVDIVSVPSHDTLMVHELRNKVDLTKFLDHHKFRFDYTFDEQCSNALVYQHTARPLVKSIFEGGNATCFAYGQTGSGKTHTMGGVFIDGRQDSTTGIYGQAAKDVFAELSKPKYQDSKLIVKCSFFEVYGGQVFDLLVHKKKVLRVFEDGRQQVVIEHLTQVRVNTVKDVLSVIGRGNGQRSSGQTSVNKQSSRSHAIFQICLYKSDKKDFYGKCSFVDLAGNERGADTDASSLETRREGAEINKSLLALKECIRALSSNARHLPFRGSKLTQVLRDSFESSRTCMIAMISPGLGSVENTLNTLHYANRVKELIFKGPDSGDEGIDRVSDTESQSDRQDVESTNSISESLMDDVNSFEHLDTSRTCASNNLSIDESIDNEECDESNSNQLDAIILQHNAMFEFFENYKSDFLNHYQSNSCEKLSQFLEDSEDRLDRLKKIIEETHGMLLNYNEGQYSEDGRDAEIGEVA